MCIMLLFHFILLCKLYQLLLQSLTSNKWDGEKKKMCPKFQPYKQCIHAKMLADKCNIKCFALQEVLLISRWNTFRCNICSVILLPSNVIYASGSATKTSNYTTRSQIKACEYFFTKAFHSDLRKPEKVIMHLLCITLQSASNSHPPINIILNNLVCTRSNIMDSIKVYCRGFRLLSGGYMSHSLISKQSRIMTL